MSNFLTSRFALLIGVLLTATSIPATAQTTVSLGPQLSTMGFGLGLSVRPSDRIGVSAEYNFYPLADLEESDDLGSTITYDPDIQGGLIMVTLHPFGGKFALGGGIQIGGASATGELEFGAGDVIELDGVDYPVDQLESFVAEFEYGNMKPAVMMGWMGKGFNFSFGVSIGSPEITIDTSGPIANLPEFQRDLEIELASINDDLSEIPVYPQIRLGWQFGF